MSRLHELAELEYDDVYRRLCLKFHPAVAAIEADRSIKYSAAALKGYDKSRQKESTG